MNIYQRKFHIDKLADEVGYIGQNFERFGGLFLHLVLRVPINAQGINLQGFPVAGVVDGVTPDGRTAAEYSAQRNYFDSPMSKASDDVRHILRKAPKGYGNLFALGDETASANCARFRCKYII